MRDALVVSVLVGLWLWALCPPQDIPVETAKFTPGTTSTTPTHIVQTKLKVDPNFIVPEIKKPSCPWLESQKHLIEYAIETQCRSPK